MRVLSILLLFGALLCFAMPVLAQGTALTIPENYRHWVPIAAGFSMAIASGLCGLGQARATAAAAEDMARNPAAAPAIRFALILGLALIESLALYTLVIIIAKVKVEF